VVTGDAVILVDETVGSEMLLALRSGEAGDQEYTAPGVLGAPILTVPPEHMVTSFPAFAAGGVLTVTSDWALPLHPVAVVVPVTV
jgi:hypothetical protein